MKEGWQKILLGSAFTTVTGGTPSKSNKGFYGHYVPFVKPPELRDSVLSSADDGLSEAGVAVARIAPSNSILVSCIGNLGKIGLNTIPVAFNQQINAIIPNAGKASPSFMFYQALSKSFKDQLESLASGTTVQIVNKSKFNAIEIVLPPLPEQQRIVALLDEAFEAIATAKAHAEQNLKNARALFESQLDAVFRQRGEGWVEMTLGEIGKVSMCKRIFKEQTTDTGDVPFYKIGSFGKIPDSFISNEIYKQYREKYPFPNKGDVLISAAGTIGRRVIFNGEDAYFQDSNIVWIANDQSQIINEYLYHFYGACKWNATKGSTILRLYNDDLRRIVISFPKSTHEQQLIASQLDALSEETQRLEALYQRKLDALDELKQSLLHQAFAGEL